MTSLKFEAIGTTWHIDIKKELSSKEEALLLAKIKKRINEFDITYSRFREDSIVMKMAHKGGDYLLPDDADKMISLYKKMYDITSGRVTPLIGQVLVDAGYDHKYSLVQKKELTKPEKWEDVISWNNPKLTLLRPAILDFGAGGKGYLVDIVSEILEKNNIYSFCVDAGGDMMYKNEEEDPLPVGLEHPTDATSVIGVVKILNESICGSAGNRRVWGNFHHIINPETLNSPKDKLSVWVISNKVLLSDLLTTGLFFVPAETLKAHFNFEYLILYEDYSIEKSEGFNVELFT